MRNRNNSQHRDQTRNPDALMTGDYLFHVESMAVRIIGTKGKEQERAYITGSIDGERTLRRFEIPVFFSSLERDQRDARHIQLFDAICDATKAKNPADATEGPNAYAFDENGTGLGLPVGAYRIAKKHQTVPLRIQRAEGNDFQKQAAQTDKAGYINKIVRCLEGATDVDL